MIDGEKTIVNYLNRNELDIFSVSEIAHILPYSDFKRGFRSLKNKDFVLKLEREIYCRADFKDEYVIGSFLVKDGGIAYWSALNFHGLTEQIPNEVFVQTSHQKRSKTILGTKYQFIMVKKNKITGFITHGYGNHKFQITDIEKTIVDCFDQPQYGGGSAVLFQAFNHAKLSAIKLVKYCKAIDNIALTKRLAYLAELLNKSNMDYFMKYAMSVRNEKYSPLLPHLPVKGSTSNRKWRLLINLSKNDIINMANG